MSYPLYGSGLLLMQRTEIKLKLAYIRKEVYWFMWLGKKGVDQALGQTGSKSSNSATFNLVCSVLSLFHSQTTTAHTLCECGPHSLLYTASSCRWATEEAQLAPDLTSFQVSSYEPRERESTISASLEKISRKVSGCLCLSHTSTLWSNCYGWMQLVESRSRIGRKEGKADKNSKCPLPSWSSKHSSIWKQLLTQI